MRAVPLAAVLLLSSLLAGCADEPAGRGNFQLEAQAIGWYAGTEAEFVLNITPSLTRSEPTYTLDRDFAIEEIRLEKQGASLGGDYVTRNPDDVQLRLVQDGVERDNVTLDATNPTVSIRLQLPEMLDDAVYTLELRLFRVGWVESDDFRVDHR